MFYASIIPYFFWIWLWKVDPILGNWKLAATSLFSNLCLIFFLNTTSSSSIFGLTYLSSSVGQNPQKALQTMLPNRVFCSSPNISCRNCDKMFCLWINYCLIFYSYLACLSLSTICVFFMVFEIGGMTILELAIGSSSTSCLMPPWFLWPFCWFFPLLLTGGSWDRVIW